MADVERPRAIRNASRSVGLGIAGRDDDPSPAGESREPRELSWTAARARRLDMHPVSEVAPFVSVVVPTFNRAAWIPGAIRSVAGQTLTALEIVVVDDGSTDGTSAVCSELERAEPRLHVVRRPNGGPSAARNTGLSHVRTPWIAFLDDDDLWHPEALEKLLNRAIESGSSAVACHAVAFSGLGSDLTARRILAQPQEYAVEPWPPDVPRDLLELRDFLFRPLVPIHAGLFSTDWVRRLGGFDERRRGAEDYDLWLRLAIHEPVPVVAEPLALVRRHSDQASRSLGLMAAGTRAVLEDFLRDHPDMRSRARPRAMRRRLALLAVEEAYAGVLAGRRLEAVRAAAAGIGHDPLVLKAYLYLGASAFPPLYRALRAAFRLWSMPGSPPLRPGGSRV